MILGHQPRSCALLCCRPLAGSNVWFVFKAVRNELGEELNIGVSILEPILAWLGLIGSICVGAIWTGQAVLEGDQMAVFWRFSVAVAFGLYYLFLLERSRRR